MAEQPPASMPDVERSYLTRAFDGINIELEKTNKLVPRSNLPDKPQDGHFYYFDREILPAIESPGFWGYVGGAWVRLDNTQATKAGHAGLWLTTPLLTPPNITPTPAKITGFDAELSLPQGASSDRTNDTLTIEEQGIWGINFSATLAIQSSSANTSREVLVDLYDDTLGTPIRTIAGYTIPRYGAVVHMQTTSLLEVNSGFSFNPLSLYVYSPSGDTITVNQVERQNFSAFRVSGPLFSV